jgi:hypothetical protein
MQLGADEGGAPRSDGEGSGADRDDCDLKPEDSPFSLPLKTFPNGERGTKSILPRCCGYRRCAASQAFAISKAEYILKARKEPGSAILGATYYAYRIRHSTTLNKSAARSTRPASMR